jgi:hypothetical protein
MGFLLILYFIASGGICAGICGAGSALFGVFALMMVAAAYGSYYQMHDLSTALKCIFFASLWLLCAIALGSAQRDLQRKRARRTY